MAVFTVPVGLTEFQRDLIEILLSIHHETLLKELNIPSTNSSASSSNTIATPPESDDLINKTEVQASPYYPNFTPRQMLYLLDTHIRAVANHPCLLVDHYMPGQFLRMEPKQRLIDPSNKFYILQKLLFELSNYQSKEFGSLSITLVAHSMKELDLIEGLVLGQNFNLKRLSGTTLYDEKNVYSRGNQSNSNSFSSTSSLTSTHAATASSSSTSVSSKASSSPSSSSSSSTNTNITVDSYHINSNLNKYTGYAKDNYYYRNKHYNKKRKLGNDNGEEKNWLFLATTKHIIHDEDLLHRYDTNLIIAFDPLIDDTMPCLNIPSIEQSQTQINVKQRRKNGTSSQQRRKRKQNKNHLLRKIPIIKLLVIDSPDHYIINQNLSNEQDVETEYNNIKKSLVHFFKTRRNINVEHEGNNIDFNQLITQALNSINDTSIQSVQLLLSEDNDETSQGEILSDWFQPQFQQNYNDTISSSLKISLHQFNLKNYQFELMQKTLARLNEINSRCEFNNNVLIDKRLEETDRQNQLDCLKKSIGSNFKTLQSRQKLQNETEKSLESVITENGKAKIIYNNLKKKYDELNGLFQEISNDESLLKTKIIEYETNCNKLKTQVDDLLEISKKKTIDEDRLRSTYQTDSNTAAKKSLELKNWEKSKQFLEGRQKNPQWAELTFNSVLSSKYNLEREVKQMKKTNQFLRGYIDTMTALNLKPTPQNGNNSGERSRKTNSNTSKNKKNAASSSATNISVNVRSNSSSTKSTNSISADISTKNTLPESRTRSTRSNFPNYT